MLAKLGRAALDWSWTPPWTNLYGAVRSLYATGTIITLVGNDPHTLFAPGPPRYLAAATCEGANRLGFFCLVPRDRLELARWLAVTVLAVTASGWRPSLTALPHWWISLSVATASGVADGGDRITSVITFLLLPLALTDPRRWHWQQAAPLDARERLLARLVGHTALLVIKFQVAFIYFSAAAAKLQITEWNDGTALYHFLSPGSPYRPTEAIYTILRPLLETRATVTLLSWSVIVLEFLLVLPLLSDSLALRRWLYAAAVAFHVAIAVVIGLVTFGIAMVATLTLYLRPFDRSPAVRAGQPLEVRPAEERERQLSH
jgi:antimicrobial peptide system SdpB family protein